MRLIALDLGNFFFSVFYIFLFGNVFRSLGIFIFEFGFDHIDVYGSNMFCEYISFIILLVVSREVH